MVLLPEFPHGRLQLADETHPFVVEALRDRKHFELCWCGSGRKYKRCHKLREQLAPPILEQVLSETRQVFWRKRGCMHPQASEDACSGRVIDAHSIQRKGPLSGIIDDTNHVMHFEKNNLGELVVKSIGWKLASTFPGYCANHDSELFSELERTKFVGNHRQCVLQAFRCVCNELYKKRGLLDSLEYQRDVIDRGCNTDEQITRQLFIHQNLKGPTKSKEELEALWHQFNGALTSNDLSRFSSQVFFFRGDLSIVSAATPHAEFDFKGRKLIDMWDLEVDGEWLSHSIMSTGDGGAVVFVWQADQQSPAQVVSSFNEYPDEEKGDVFIQYCFLKCENVYFSKIWWDSLTASQKAQVRRYAEALHYEGGEFVVNKNRLVNWKF